LSTKLWHQNKKQQQVQPCSNWKVLAVVIDLVAPVIAAAMFSPFPIDELLALVIVVVLECIISP
jgi:hypothetical protein